MKNSFFTFKIAEKVGRVENSKKKNGVYGFPLYMAYLVPRNHFKDAKLMFFYWLSRGHIDNWSKNDFSHRKLKKADRGRKKTLKIAQKMLQSHFWHNSVNFCRLGCSKSPQLMVYIDNQFWPFSFCEKFIFNIENGRKSGTCWKFGGKKRVYAFGHYMAYSAPWNQFKNTKLTVFYWQSMGCIDNWSKNDFIHPKFKKKPKGVGKKP